MVAPVDIQGQRPIAQIDRLLPTAPIGDAREEANARLTQLTIGQRLQGTVASLLDDGSFIVKLADTAVRTNLPSGSKVGDQLQMTLVGTEPRATFLLDGESAAAPATFSPTARLIDSILHNSTATTLLGKTPLVNSGAAPPAQLATALQTALGHSGLFYESHVQQWANGQRPLADLLREPQNINARIPDTTAVTSTDVALRPDAALNPDTARIVNLQLNTIDQPRLQWQGEVWPGQQMEWEVSEQPQQQSAEREEPERSWQSVVRFDLPTLGKISATITLVGDHVQMQVRTADPASAETLREHGTRLADAIDAAGAKLDVLNVRPEDDVA
ncbi:flagellar hook-length control protein FliK [Actimicrobium antarcticum]|uniref:Flagellar hook-length control protein-like C-terminal domain-containing protein n=1 Tax=Actimicrobium antarcticum TaxID=1051899 RepID=A0ABP7SR93_9BURK